MATPNNDANPGPIRTLLLVGVVAAGAALLVTTSHELSRERIAENQRVRLQGNLHTVFDPVLHDNDLSATRLRITAPELLGSPAAVDVYVATLAGDPAGAIFATVAPDGYNAPIRLLVGVLHDGTVNAVRVVGHRETPGLGDPIEIEKSDWITQFDRTSLREPPPEQWLVDKDGGAFDSITGATVTPRAVVKAVRNTLLYFEQHREELFAAAAALQEEDDGRTDD